ESGVDLTRYLCDEFNRIRQDHGPAMVHVSENWPGEGIVRQLVRRACGQFIYAATIILNITVPEDHDSPYPDLDVLYLQILSVCKQKELLLDVLAHLLNKSHPVGKVRMLLFGLHSVLYIPDKDSEDITVRHSSFVDFLTDKKRSGSYYLNKSLSEDMRH
ncbi:hypothetical protein GYMLUDRAFT_115183, partial [Collybiopsis luxurians FD-317 M1]